MQIIIFLFSICLYKVLLYCPVLMRTFVASNSELITTTSIKQQNTYYTVKYGDTVLIPCVIENRKHANVIWQYSKSRIPETLTVGYFYYRKDYRIRVIANTSAEREQAWNLEIRKVKFEDEGYYLCKVMAEPESLKRVVYLKVEIDLKLEPTNPIANLDDNLVLICNTSFALSESHKNRLNHHHSHLKLVWYKDNQQLSNDFYQQQLNLDNTNKNASLVLNAQNYNYKIEYFTKPVLWSKLHINRSKLFNMGLYKCVFRNQTVSTLVTVKNCKIYFFLKLKFYFILNSFFEIFSNKQKIV